MPVDRHEYIFVYSNIKMNHIHWKSINTHMKKGGKHLHW